MDLPGIPDSIEWSKVRDFLNSLGIDLSDVAREPAIQIGYDAITCTVYARDADGLPYLDHTGKNAAVHEVSIRCQH